MPSRPWQQMSQVPEVACEFAFPSDPMFQHLHHLDSYGMELPICELGVNASSHGLTHVTDSES